MSPFFLWLYPFYRTPEHYLREMIDSIIDQTYTNWELCIADGSPRGQSVERVLKRYAQKDPRVRYAVLGGNRAFPAIPMRLLKWLPAIL